jgi:hypothetical protein
MHVAKPKENILVMKTEERDHLGDLSVFEHNIKMDLTEVGCQWRTLVNSERNLQIR